MSTEKINTGRGNCRHETLRFGSGDYYIFCANEKCGARWATISTSGSVPEYGTVDGKWCGACPGEANQGIGNQLSGAYRVHFSHSEDLERVKAQLEVARAGYAAAIETANHQTRTTKEFDIAEKRIRELEIDNQNLCAALDKNRPEFELHLPDGDTRTHKIWFMELGKDGKWHISVDVSQPENPDKERLDWAEAHPGEFVIAMLKNKLGEADKVREAIDKLSGLSYNNPE